MESGGPYSKKNADSFSTFIWYNGVWQISVTGSVNENLLALAKKITPVLDNRNNLPMITALGAINIGLQ